ncbi:MAG: hypothetical protein J7M18_03320 [Candidatus Eremiobacteraeota bacterium]|nr:hypothetical protein [Candidatus Eremiobacteraeota bacterium]
MKSRSARDFYNLFRLILFHAATGLLRVDFVRKVLNILVDFSGCDFIVLWLRESGRCFRCDVINDEDRTCY